MKKNILSIGGVNLINGIAGIAFIPLALNSLGLTGYGVYSIFILISSYMAFIELGISKYFIRIVARSTELLEEVKALNLAVGMYIRLLTILLITLPILLYLIPNVIFPTDNTSLITLIVFLAFLDYLLSVPVMVYLIYHVGKENFINISKYNLISGLSRHFMLIGAVLVSESVIFLIIVVLFRRSLDIFYARKYLGKLPKGSWSPNLNYAKFKFILRESVGLSAVKISNIVMLSLGTYLVNNAFSLKEVGLFKATFDLATKVWFFSNSIALVLFPRFSSLLKNENDRKQLNLKIPKYLNLSWLGYNTLFLMSLFILPYLGGLLSIQDMILFQLILFGACINAHANLSYEYLQADYKIKKILFSTITTILLMGGIFYLLLPEFELYAIGLAWLISQTVNALILDFYNIALLSKRRITLGLVFNIFVGTFAMIVFYWKYFLNV